MQVYMDGVAVGAQRYCPAAIANGYGMLSDLFFVPAAAGVHKIDLYWGVDGGTTGSMTGNLRDLTAREI